MSMNIMLTFTIVVYIVTSAHLGFVYHKNFTDDKEFVRAIVKEISESQSAVVSSNHKLEELITELVENQQMPEKKKRKLWKKKEANEKVEKQEKKPIVKK